MKTTFVLLLLCSYLSTIAQVCGTMGTPAFTSQSVTVLSANTGSVSLSWTNVNPDNYLLQYKVAGTSQFTTAYSGLDLSYTIDGLLLGNSYDFKVKATRECEIVPGEPSIENTSTTITIVFPPALDTPSCYVFRDDGDNQDSKDYNPINPPQIYVSNYFLYSSIELYLDGTLSTVKSSSPSTPIYFAIPQPGSYIVKGLNTSGAAASSEEIIILKGDIPAPTIRASNGGILYYDRPVLDLTASDKYTQYEWYLNNVHIDGSAQTVSVSKPGMYTVNACATYPDGSTQCKMSSPIQVVGDMIHINYVRERKILVENISDPTQLEGLSNDQVNVSTLYMDGFARPVQEVKKAYSPLGNDLVTSNQYDLIGREFKKFLPYVPSSDGSGDYYALPWALNPLFAFYQEENDNIADTSVPFVETVFERSPLSRVLQQGSAGEEWQIGSGHTKGIDYLNNTASDLVWIWIASGNSLSASAYYPDNSLSMLEHTDENGNLSREFRDKFDRVVLMEKVVEGGLKLRTYFIFDDMGRLIYMIPPKTVADLPEAPSVNITAEVLAKECYSYTYDNRGRVTVKNIPGAGAVYIVYDQWDRVVLTQHANQRSRNKWSFNKYDALDRIIMTGEITLAGDYVAATQSIASFYATVSSDPTIRYEKRGGSIHNYSNQSYPVLTNETQAYFVSYYDGYDFLAQFGAGYEFVPEPSLNLATSSSRTQTLVTGIKAIILGTQTYLKTVSYYDEKHRLVQVVSDNHLGGIDRSSNELDFVGKVLRTKLVHNGTNHVTIDQRTTYDHAGRKLKVFHTVNNGSANDGIEVLLGEYHYNELGQLIERNIHSTDGGNKFLQSEDMSYNIQGWLSQVNPTGVENNVTYQDQYGFELSYTNTTSGVPDFQPSFNGNIAAFTETRSAQQDITGNPYKSTFSYHYDARDQLIQARYFQPTLDGQYDLSSVTYDPNGNIKTLKRKGLIGSVPVPGIIDDLIYHYSGNQLIQVEELADMTKGFIKK